MTIGDAARPAIGGSAICSSLGEGMFGEGGCSRGGGADLFWGGDCSGKGGAELLWMGRRLFWGRRNVLGNGYNLKGENVLGSGYNLKGENVLGSVLGREDNGLFGKVFRSKPSVQRPQLSVHLC